MISRTKVEELILSILVADSYCLGTHWIYDEKQLLSKQIDWNNLNKPLAVWHKGKTKGEFTHYGDQTIWLYEFLKDKETFDENEFLDFWKKKMESYEGYIDGASRNTLENIQSNITPSGSDSTDLSIVGRIVPLLLVSNSKDEFLQNVNKFVKLTHNSNESLNASKFFARLLLLSLEQKDIQTSIENLKEDFDSSIQTYIQKGIDSKDKQSFEIIREFGPACDVSEGFAGIIHLLCKYDNLKEMLVQNAKAGGDSSARAMISTAILMSQKTILQLPQDWLNIKFNI